jgi:hypothetical protein
MSAFHVNNSSTLARGTGCQPVFPVQNHGPAARATGFSFPEVLFAVIILGIGFIMIAAIFPVAISQSKMTLDETAASAVARAKVAEIQGVTYDTSAPTGIMTNWPVAFMPTGPNNPPVRPFESYTGTFMPAWDKIRGLELLQNDPRYACVVLYRRAGTPNLTKPLPTDWSNTAQIYLIEVTCRGTQRPGGGTVTMNKGSVAVKPRLSPTFDQFDFGIDTSGNPPAFNNPNNLAAHQIMVKLTNDGGGTGIDTVTLSANSPAPGLTQSLSGAVAEGTYIVISNDTTATTPGPGGHTNVTGRIYRAGLQRLDLDKNGLVFELQPGNDMQSGMEDLKNPTPAYCVGRERLPDGSFVGASQDVSIYTTTIPVKP